MIHQATQWHGSTSPDLWTSEQYKRQVGETSGKDTIIVQARLQCYATAFLDLGVGDGASSALYDRPSATYDGGTRLSPVIATCFSNIDSSFHEQHWQKEASRYVLKTTQVQVPKCQTSSSEANWTRLGNGSPVPHHPGRLKLRLLRRLHRSHSLVPRHRKSRPEHCLGSPSLCQSSESLRKRLLPNLEEGEVGNPVFQFRQ